MKIKVIKTIAFAVLLIFVINIPIYATKLTIELSTDEEQYHLGGDIAVIIDWGENMQAASFELRYDSDKIKFVAATDISDAYYNADTKGIIKVNWASMEEVDYSDMVFIFEAIKTGTANIFIEKAESFADANLVSPTEYDFTTLGNKNIKIISTSDNNEDDEEIVEQDTYKPIKKDTYATSEKTTEESAADNTKTSKTMPKTGFKTVLIPLSILSN